MRRVEVIIFHRPAAPADGRLTVLLAEARERLALHQAALFERVGGRVRIVDVSARAPSASFGDALREEAEGSGAQGLVVLGSGAVPLLRRRDAERLVEAAARRGRRALTNNRYSSDVCAVAGAAALADVPPLPSDNALPRWLEERAGYRVDELRGRRRLGVDIDSPLDLALLADLPGLPRELADLTREHALAVPRRDDLRAVVADPRRELLVFGRSSGRTLRWLERNVRCRVRFLGEERGLRASSPLAMADDPGSAGEGRDGTGDPGSRDGGEERGLPPPAPRPPRATLAALLARYGPGSLGSVVAGLADAAVLDARVLLAARYGADEATWPRPEDRFASDLLRADAIEDAWLRDLTRAAADSPLPILLGAHTLVGPGLPLLLARG